MRFIVIVFILVSFVSIATGNSHSPVVAIGVGDMPPYAYKQGEELVGFGVDRVKRIFKEGKVNVNFRAIPFARAYQLVLSDPLYMYFPMIRSPAREKSFQWVGPILLPINYSLYRLKSRDDKELQ